MVQLYGNVYAIVEIIVLLLVIVLKEGIQKVVAVFNEN